MVKKFLLSALLMATMLFTWAPQAAKAAPAYEAPFQVSITYLNASDAEADISINFYAEKSGTAIPFSPAKLPGKATASLAVGSVSGLGGTFKGSAVLSSNQPVIATIVQFSTDPAVRNRPLSNGFTDADGNTRQLVATVLKAGNGGVFSTVFSVQNADSVAVDLKVEYFAVGATTPTHTDTVTNLAVGAAAYFDAGKIAQLPAGFSGSAVVTTTATGGTNPAKAVVSVNELQTTGGGSSSFEGTSTSGAKVFMPSALCSFGGIFTTFYAVQNASTEAVSFRVVFRVPGKPDVTSNTYNLTGGGKKSIDSCSTDGQALLPADSNGSAVIERVSGTGTLVAVGKVAGGNITSAFLGVAEGKGSARVGLSYLRYSPDNTFGNATRQRGFIAIQNIGTTPATNVKVQYVDRNGAVVKEVNLGTIEPGAKANSNPQSAGALDSCGRFGEYDAPGAAACSGGQFGGGAIVVADAGAQLAAVVRITTGNPATPDLNDNGAGEDYTGVNLP